MRTGNAPFAFGLADRAAEQVPVSIDRSWQRPHVDYPSVDVGHLGDGLRSHRSDNDPRALANPGRIRCLVEEARVRTLRGRGGADQLVVVRTKTRVVIVSDAAAMAISTVPLSSAADTSLWTPQMSSSPLGL